MLMPFACLKQKGVSQYRFKCGMVSLCQPLEALSTSTKGSQLFESSVAIIKGIKCLPNLLGKTAELQPTTPETQLIETLDHVGMKVSCSTVKNLAKRRYPTDVSVARHRCESTGSAAHSCVALIEACLKAKPPEKR